ncbi:IclR family transcriptional regulator domain-containing protein [Massilia niastensis]|uniref:IclR family transcriptional regulator domain-containing protein n=1 Tax=Massilia niastensis TaxID=544911 RepID=UPI00047700B4|nr:IclR family transcriptional regulator C-terminal domain-containing protein [Massilia niastensis]
MKTTDTVTREIPKHELIDGLVKGLGVIQAFTEESMRMGASEVAARVGISRSAARRYLLTLVHLGMAATDGHDFWLTSKVLGLGRSYLDSARLPRAIMPFLQRLTHDLQESTNFAVLEGDDVVYVSRVNAPRVLRGGFDPGTRLPAHASTAGRVLLAAQTDAGIRAYLERVELIAYTHMTLVDRDQLFLELQRIREAGYGVSANQYEMGLRGISVPVKNRRGAVIGALSVSMIISNMPENEAVARCVPALQATANTLMLWV